LSGPVTNLTAIGGSTSVALGASPVSGAAGYVFLRREDGAFPTSQGVVNGVYPSSWVLPAGTSFVAASPAGGHQNSGLTTGKLYSYTVFPYSQNPGGASYNYYTANPAQASAWTDATDPYVISKLPLNAAANVNVSANLVLTFNENIFKGTGNILIRQIAEGSPVIQTIDVTSAQVTTSGAVMTINPATDLPAGTYMYVEMSGASAVDIAGNHFPGLVSISPHRWYFTTALAADVTAPLANAFTPADNAINVAPDANLTITFNESVKKGTGNILLKKVSDNSTLESIPVTSGLITISGNTVTINPSFDLPGSTAVYVNIPNTAIADLANNAYAGINNATTWNFTTVTTDNTPPSLVSQTPADNATGISVGANVIIQFNEAVKLPVTAGTEFIRIRKSDHATFEQFNLPSARVTGYGTNTITIDPTLNFEAGTTYYVQAFSAFEDLAGNDFPDFGDETFWNFTTAGSSDVTPPLATVFSPADNATGIVSNSNLVVTFNEPVQKGTGDILIRRVSANNTLQSIPVTGGAVTVSGNSITINPPTDLPASTAVYVQIPNTAIKDLANNSYAGISTATVWNFTTAAAPDVTPPAMFSLAPAHNATNVAGNTNIYLVFNENVVVSAASKNIFIKRVSDNVVIKSFNTASSFIDIVNTQAEILQEASTGTGLPEGVQLYVQVEAGFFTDLAGNPFAGFSSSTDWRFTTQVVNQPPAILLTSPADDATLVSVSDDFVINFNEAVVKPATPKYIFVRDFDSGVDYQTITVSSANVTVSGSSVTIHFPADLPYNKHLFVHTSDYPFVDEEGLGYPGIPVTDKSTWDFYTAGNPDVTAPEIVSFSPVIGATGVPVATTQLQLTFDEPIQKQSLGNILIRDFSNTIFVQYYPAINDNRVTVTGNVATITLPANLAYGTSYYVQVVPATFEDLAGNDHSGFTTTLWQFSTEAAPDVTPPVIQVLAPEDNSTEVLITSDLLVSFNENIQKGTGNILVKRVSDNVTIQTINVAGGNVTASGTTLSIDPADLPAGTALYVTIPATAVRDNSNNYFPGIASSSAWNFTTSKLNQTISFTAIPAKEFGDVPFALTASATSGLPVSFVSSNTSVATVSGSTVTIVGVGTSTFTATQGGNATYNAAAPVEQTLTVTKASQSISFNTPGGKTVGDAPFALTATASSGLAVSYTSSNTSVATISGNTVTIAGAGTATITASQPGNGNYNSATPVERTLTVSKATQSISFTALAPKTFGDASFALTATASSDLAITYTSSNTSVATVAGNTITIAGAGATTITASQPGNGNYNAALPAAQTLTVAKATQTISFDALAAQAFEDASFELTATASSGLAVTYTSSNTSVATISGRTVTFEGLGTTTITASQSGNGNYDAAIAVERTLTVTTTTQTISFAALAPKTFGDASFALSGTASSGQEVTYTSSNTSVATVSGSMVTIVGAGTSTITASQAGNSDFPAATPVSQTLTVNKADQTITFDALPEQDLTAGTFQLAAIASSGLT
jgi:methionine-rich copper-binding protein CopC